MSPDQILQFISAEYPDLVAQMRHRPDGWAFFLGPPSVGPNSNRIFRALQGGPGSTTRLKLSVTCRHELKDEDILFEGDESALRLLVDSEIALYREVFVPR